MVTILVLHTVSFECIIHVSVCGVYNYNNCSIARALGPITILLLLLYTYRRCSAILHVQAYDIIYNTHTCNYTVASTHFHVCVRLYTIYIQSVEIGSDVHRSWVNVYHHTAVYYKLRIISGRHGISSKNGNLYNNNNTVHAFLPHVYTRYLL